MIRSLSQGPGNSVVNRAGGVPDSHALLSATVCRQDRQVHISGVFMSERCKGTKGLGSGGEDIGRGGERGGYAVGPWRAVFRCHWGCHRTPGDSVSRRKMGLDLD